MAQQTKFVRQKNRFSLPDRQEIYIFTLEYFLATKLEAFFSRGIKDPRFSSDLEDIVAVLSDAKNFESIGKDNVIISYLRTSFDKIFNDLIIVEAINGFLVGSVSGQYDLILKRVKKLSDFSD